MRGARAGEIAREANKLGIPIVAQKDQKAAADYFSGVINESEQIDTAMRARTLIRKGDNAR